MTTPTTILEATTQAAHHRSAMVARRDIGIKITVGLVTLDLVMVKFASDAARHVRNPDQMTLVIILVAWGALVTLCGMLYQIESRNRRDREQYRFAESQAAALRRGADPHLVAEPIEDWKTSISNSWASTWPAGGLLLLTSAITLFAHAIAQVR